MERNKETFSESVIHKKGQMNAEGKYKRTQKRRPGYFIYQKYSSKSQVYMHDG